MAIKIALAGNPNCGKTTLFNALTGSNQYVGNWAGVTVEKKEGRLKKDSEVIITDLPGIYSLSPYTPEEVVARNYLIDEEPDAILNIVDGTNLERNLYLSTQLIEIGIPVVVAINMMDIVNRNGDSINTAELSRRLGCKIVNISALKGTGIEEAVDEAIAAAKSGKTIPMNVFSGVVEHALAHIEEAAIHNMPEEKQRWYSVKIFERDSKVLEKLNLSYEIISHIEKDIKAVEDYFDDDAEAIITNERYNYIVNNIRSCFTRKNKDKLSVSDRIDRVVTNRFLAIPLFILIMWLVYYISIGSIGNATVEFMNTTVFGKWIIPAVTSFLTSVGCAEWLVSLIADGALGGAGAILGFVPQMIILFLLLSVLEDCGYMSRVAFIMDKLFRKFGLSGKSFIPLLVATGCSVPGIMASRTIDRDRDRRMTVMTTAFIPCGAKMPLVGMIAGALFGGSALIAVSAYLIGIASVVVSGIILKKTKPFKGEPSPFVMELPSYHAPVPINIFRATWERSWSFIKRAGTVIVAASMVVWVLNSASIEGGLHYTGGQIGSDSILAAIGGFIAWIFKPLGFGNWQSAVATVLGLLAKEQIVSTLGTLSSMSGTNLAGEFFSNSALVGMSFMIFNLLCAPCIAAMGAIRKEMNSAKWTFFAIGYMCIFAYSVSLMIYQFGSWFTGGGNIWGTVFAVAVLAVMLYLLFRENKNATE